MNDFGINVALDIVAFAGEIHQKYMSKVSKTSNEEKIYSFEDLLSEGKTVGG